MTKCIDLNSDIGELEGGEGRALDRTILQIVTSCNIACGAHAGSPTIIEDTVIAALENSVLIGAHPSYPDRKNFGRVSMQILHEDLRGQLETQIAGFLEIVKGLGGKATHLKAHGALYNDAAHDPELANLICKCAIKFDIPVIFGLPNSEIAAAAQSAKLDFIAEGFVDRSYEEDGTLTPRSIFGAVHSKIERIEAQATSIALSHTVKTRTGLKLPLSVGTLCLHGDTRGAAENALRVKGALTAAGCEVRGYA